MTELTDNNPKPRIVSRIRYLGHLTAKKGLRLVGNLLASLGFSLWSMCGFFLLPLLMMAIYLTLSVLSNRASRQTLDIFIFMTGIGTLLYGGRHLMQVGKAVQQKAENMPSVIPMTPVLAAQLSLQDSLVRASNEPMQPQQEVLLRPAQSSEETPADQLLRPH